MPEPGFDNERTGAYSMIVSIAPRAEAGPGSVAIAGRMAEELQNRLRKIPNTKFVDLYGRAREEIRVSVDHEALAALGLTLDRALPRARALVRGLKQGPPVAAPSRCASSALRSSGSARSARRPGSRCRESRT